MKEDKMPEFNCVYASPDRFTAPVNNDADYPNNFESNYVPPMAPVYASPMEPKKPNFPIFPKKENKMVEPLEPAKPTVSYCAMCGTLCTYGSYCKICGYKLGDALDINLEDTLCFCQDCLNPIKCTVSFCPYCGGKIR